MADAQAAKARLSALLLGRVPGIEAVGTGTAADGTPLLLVTWLGPVPPNLPPAFEGIPLRLERSPGPIRPL